MLYLFIFSFCDWALSNFEEVSLWVCLCYWDEVKDFIYDYAQIFSKSLEFYFPVNIIFIMM